MIELMIQAMLSIGEAFILSSTAFMEAIQNTVFSALGGQYGFVRGVLTIIGGVYLWWKLKPLRRLKAVGNIIGWFK